MKRLLACCIICNFSVLEAVFRIVEYGNLMSLKMKYCVSEKPWLNLGRETFFSKLLTKGQARHERDLMTS